MTTSRTSASKKINRLAYLLVAALSCGSLLPQGAQADFQGTGLTETIDSLSGGTTATAVASNIATLQAKLTDINSQIASATTTEAAQLRAVALALQGIITRLQQGLTIQSYSTTSDEATLETTVVIGFVDASGNQSTLTIVVPPADGYDSTGSGTEDEDEDEDSSSSSNSDILTQILQQLGSSLGGDSNNPLSAIQNTLNGLTAPVQALTGELTDAATAGAASAALQCAPDAKKTASGVAVYDSSTGKLYMPDGSVLQAHSGNGSFMDNPSASNLRNRGPIPTNVYTLSMRESRFHGIEAIRLNPTGGGNMYGRDGFLVHPPLRRGSVGSAGCIAITTDYAKFLQAFKSGQVKQVVVVSSAEEAKQACSPPAYNTPSPGSGS